MAGGWATATSFLTFCFGYAVIGNGNSQGAAAPSWFAEMTTALLVLTVAVLVVVTMVRLGRNWRRRYRQQQTAVAPASTT